jgi:hypothetical protein
MSSANGTAANNSAVEIIEMASPLAHKVRKVAAGSPDAPSLEAAEKQIAQMSADYEKRLSGELASLIDDIHAVMALPQNDRAARLEPFYDAVADIKGQAATFDYELVTLIADALRKFLLDTDRTREHDLTLVRQYLGLMQVVMEQKLRGLDSPAAKKVLAALDELDKQAS